VPHAGTLRRNGALVKLSGGRRAAVSTKQEATMRPHIAILGMALCAIAALAPRAAGQNPPPPNRGPGRRMEILFKDITLTPAQQTKIDSIQSHYREQMPSFNPGSPPDSATREKVRALFRHELDDFRAVLTADQQSTFDRNVEAMRARRGRGS
jgi:Spy/CpxP family protein refolding chaperone